MQNRFRGGEKNYGEKSTKNDKRNNKKNLFKPKDSTRPKGLLEKKTSKNVTKRGDAIMAKQAARSMVIFDPAKIGMPGLFGGKKVLFPISVKTAGGLAWLRKNKKR